jgi:transposase
MLSIAVYTAVSAFSIIVWMMKFHSFAVARRFSGFAERSRGKALRKTTNAGVSPRVHRFHHGFHHFRSESGLQNLRFVHYRHLCIAAYARAKAFAEEADKAVAARTFPGRRLVADCC